jgi:hypothetical protein
MCLKRVDNATRLLIASLFSVGLAVILSDSQAEAGLLKNSVKVGDRSAMTILSTPKRGQRKRIRIPVRSAPPPRQPQTYGWFWEQHRAADNAAGPQRWSDALASLQAHRAEGGAVFAESRLRDIAEQFESQVANAARAHGVSEILLLAVIAVESSGKTRAASPKGAKGLMQLIPATARRFGVANSFDPAQNILGGAAYLDWLLRNFDEDPILALAGYNAGEGAVKRYKGVPPYTETRDYVVKVFDALAAAQDLCQNPADTPRSTCGWPSAPPG